MEKTEQQWEEDVEEEEEEEGVLRKRKSRNQNGGTEITITDASSNKVINVHSDKIGGKMHFSVPVNGAEDSALVQQQVVVEEDDLEISSHGGFDPIQQGPFEELYFNNGGFDDVEKLLRGESEDVNRRSDKCVYFDDDKGTGFTNGVEQSSTESSTLEKKPAVVALDATVLSFDAGKSLRPETNHHVDEILKHDNFPVSSIQPSEIKELDKSYETFGNKEIESADINPIRENDHETIELDVEGVLEKQNTHDLFCPNCNSCITKRVIVRKRKRKIRISSEEPKRNKLEALIPSDLDAISADATSSVNTHLDGNLPPGANDYDRDRGPDIFRCLSCFSIFIPTGSGFKLFRMFGDKSENESTQQIPSVKRSWFSFIFTSDKGKVVVEQRTSQSAGMRENNVGVQSSNLNEPYAEASSIPEAGTSQSAGVRENNVGVQSSNLNEASSILELLSTETIVAEPQKNGERILTSSAESTKFEEAMVDVREKFDDAINKSTDEKDTIVSSQTPISVLRETDMNGKVNISSRMPCYNEQNVRAELLTETITEDENRKVKVGDEDEKETEPTWVPALGEMDMNEKVNISSHIPRDNKQNAGAALLTESITEDGSKMVNLSERDGTYHSEFSQQSTVTTKWDIYTEKPFNVDCNLLISSVQDASLLQEGRVDIGKILKDMPTKDNANKDTILTVESEQVKTTASQLSQNIIGSPETEALPCVETQIGVVEQRDATMASKVLGLDIIKSIVYGGLVESITSLGVVSSAAGADASTGKFCGFFSWIFLYLHIVFCLIAYPVGIPGINISSVIAVNVLALGLANLIGGLFVIGHDLWEVKESQTGGASNQVSEQVDRYQELLGRRSDFTLHAVVAVSSFLIFGLLPPVIYGFSFRKSNDRDLKLVAVAAGSLVCIILLAVGKAYVRRPPKSYFKTVMYFVIMGIMASGASYIAGGLIMKLLEKLGLFEPSQGVSVLKPGLVNPAWASY
ncbi:hypothetical protein LguiB_015164 [Lonicera macranthoides]